MFKIKTFLVLICLSLFTAIPVLAEEPANDDAILAQVGSATLTNKDLSVMAELLPPQAQVMLQSNPDLKKELITRWVDINLLAQESMAMGLDKDRKMVLKIDETKNRLLVEALIAKRIDTASPVSADEIEAYYNDNGKEFEQGEQVQVQHILIRTEAGASEEEQVKAKEKISEIAEKLKNGAAFSALAEEYSEDPGSKNNGGTIEYFGRGQMVKEFEDAAFATLPGETCAPVQTSFGWHLIHVVDKKPAAKLPLDQVSTQITSLLQKQKGEKQLSDLLTELKKKYPVTLANK